MSMNGPPINTAIVVDEAVTTFDRPMYRPEAAFGMMSVISAQSTARNVPCDAPKSAAPTVATGTFGATAINADAERAERGADVDDGLPADPIGQSGRRDDRSQADDGDGSQEHVR